MSVLTTSEPFWPSGVHRPKVINHFEKNIYWVSYQYQSGEAGQYQMKKSPPYSSFDDRISFYWKNAFVVGRVLFFLAVVQSATGTVW